MSSKASAYLALAVIGSILPLTIFGFFFADHGLDFGEMGDQLFASTVAAAAFADLAVSSIVFLWWSSREARAIGVSWWPFLLANLFVGLSCALPAFLYVRERRREAAAEPGRVAAAA